MRWLKGCSVYKKYHTTHHTKGVNVSCKNKLKIKFFYTKLYLKKYIF